MKLANKRKKLRALYTYFGLFYALILVFSNTNRTESWNLFLGSWIVSLINTIVLLSLTVWMIIELFIFFKKIEKSINYINSYSWFTKKETLKTMAKFLAISVPCLILIEVSTFISQETIFIEYSWMDFESFIISSTILFLLSLFALIFFWITYLKLRNLFGLDINRRILLIIYQNIEDENFEDIQLEQNELNIEKYEDGIYTFLVSLNEQKCQLVMYKKSLELKIFKKGFYPPK